MTHPGWWHDYVPWYDGSNYWYDPGVELTREIGGTTWIVDAKVSWYVPLVVNSASFDLMVHFGPPGSTGVSCGVERFSYDDVGMGTNPNGNFIRGWCYPSVELREWAGLDTTIARYVRLERQGPAFKVRLSADGVSWKEALSTLLPDNVACGGQKVAITGGAWFSPQGSYADYDYVRFRSGVAAKRVFLTQMAPGADFGGPAAADTICNQEAASVRLSGTYRAWLNDPSRISRTDGGYFRTDGVRVAETFADLTDGTLAAPINVTAGGTTLSSVQAWTNVHLGPGAFPGPASCDGWTSAAAGAYGWTGRPESTNSEWTESQILPCGPNRTAHFYCFED